MTSNISSEKKEFKTIAYAARINDNDTLHQRSSGRMFTALSGGTNQEITQVNYRVKRVLRILLPVKGGLRNVLFQAI